MGPYVDAITNQLILLLQSKLMHRRLLLQTACITSVFSVAFGAEFMGPYVDAITNQLILLLQSKLIL